MDLIDLEENAFKTLPVHEVLTGRYPPLRYIAQVDEDGYFTSLRTGCWVEMSADLVLTFEDLLQRTPFAGQMREMPADVGEQLSLAGGYGIYRAS